MVADCHYQGATRRTRIVAMFASDFKEKLTGFLSYLARFSSEHMG
jgi:hypothetical protein